MIKKLNKKVQFFNLSPFSSHLTVKERSVKMTPFIIECYILNVAFIASSVFFIKETLELFTKAIGFEAFLWASGIWFLGMLVCWYNWPV